MVREVFVESALNKHEKRDEWFLDDYSLNPYRLCEFNCIYCYIRGSGYGVNMGKEIAVKINVPTLLEKELGKLVKKGGYGFIALGSSTEPWMYLEEKYEVTRKCLKVIFKFGFPVHCLTKSNLILRDLDLLKEIDEKVTLPSDLRGRLNRKALVTFSLSTLDEGVASIFEPNAPKPRDRLKALTKMVEEGLYAGVAFIPTLPFISDDGLEEMIKEAKEYQARYVFVGALTLYGLGKKLYYKALNRYFPELLPKYERLFKGFSQPSREYQRKLELKAKKLCEKYGIKYMIL